MASPVKNIHLRISFLILTFSVTIEGTWNDLFGTWTDNGNSWSGSVPSSGFHYGPARLWTTPLDSDQYVITSRVQILRGNACGHTFKYKPGGSVTSSSVTQAWGYFLWSNAYMYITSSGPESSPRVDFATQTGSWYNLKSVVDGTNVKIYVNNRLVKEITMSGKEANSRTNNYVGIWCHSMDPIAGDSFKVSLPRCPALTVNRLVKTFPDSCVTSQKDKNTTCSFSCPQGYQLQGPSSTQCGLSGHWTNNAKNISCIGTWNDLFGTWTDNGNSWSGSVQSSGFHYGPARLWTTPLDSDQYVITSRVQILKGNACGHTFKYKPGGSVTSSSVTQAWGYFLWSNAYMYITSSGPESSPRVDFATQTGSWYNLKSVVDGTNVKIYVNNRLVKEITMSGKEANSRTNNYVGIWCHSMDPIAGDSFKGSICNKSCSSSARRRREVSPQENDVYTLGEGPIYLARGKEEEIQSSGLGMRGSSPFIIIALVVTSIAFGGYTTDNP